MERLMLSIDEAAKSLSIGKTKLYSELAAGRISAIKLGQRTLISHQSLNDYIANLEAYSSQISEG